MAKTTALSDEEIPAAGFLEINHTPICFDMLSKVAMKMILMCKWKESNVPSVLTEKAGMF